MTRHYLKRDGDYLVQVSDADEMWKLGIEQALDALRMENKALKHKLFKLTEDVIFCEDMLSDVEDALEGIGAWGKDAEVEGFL